MKIDELLEKVFESFIYQREDSNLFKDLKSVISINHLDILAKKLNSLEDPSEYFNVGFNDNKIVDGFFLYIDLLSALIIYLGEEAINNFSLYADKNSRYFPWVLKYISDQRFYPELINKFPLLFE